MVGNDIISVIRKFGLTDKVSVLLIRTTDLTAVCILSVWLAHWR